MTSIEIISLVITFIGVFSFSAIFTILYRNYATLLIAELRSGKRDIELIDEVIYERQTKVKRRRKIGKIIKNIIFYTVLAIVIPFFILSLINLFTKRVTMIGNKGLMVVASGSMSAKHKDNSYLITNGLDNQIPTYDIIILEKVKKEDIKQYDIISYYDKVTYPEGKNIIHRVREIKSNGSYVTRGDNVDTDDSYNPTYDDVIGRYTGKSIKGLGIFIVFLQSYPGIITVVSLVYCLLMIDRLTEKINRVQDKRIKQLEDVLDYSEELDTNGFKAEYVEKIYYKGFMYSFDENGFIEKKSIKGNEYSKKSDNAIIKEVTNVCTSETVAKEIVIDEENGE